MIGLSFWAESLFSGAFVVSFREGSRIKNSQQVFLSMKNIGSTMEVPTVFFYQSEMMMMVIFWVRFKLAKLGVDAINAMIREHTWFCDRPDARFAALHNDFVPLVAISLTYLPEGIYQQI